MSAWMDSSSWLRLRRSRHARNSRPTGGGAVVVTRRTLVVPWTQHDYPPGNRHGYVAAVQQQFPGLVFTPGTAVDSHHNQARFTWGLGPRGSAPIVEGFDVLILDNSGQIAAVHGFLDKVPA